MTTRERQRSQGGDIRDIEIFSDRRKSRGGDEVNEAEADFGNVHPWSIRCQELFKVLHGDHSTSPNVDEVNPVDANIGYRI